MRHLVALSLALLSSGCATSFTGDARVPGGASGCAKVCLGLGMELAGMVVMGEYSNGCVCQVPGRPPLSPAAAAAAGLPASAGVMVQMDGSRPRH